MAYLTWHERQIILVLMKLQVNLLRMLDTADKLIDLQKKMKELDADEKKSGLSTVNNTMFIGSTADLQKMLKKQRR